MVMALILVLFVARNDVSREKEALENEMSLIAQSRAKAFSIWMGQQKTVIDSIAATPATQLYLADRFDPNAKSDDDDRIQQGQQQYIASQLKAIASRSGFSVDRPDVRSNAMVPQASGISVISPNGVQIAATGGPLPYPGPLMKEMKSNHQTYTRLLSLPEGPALAILAPVQAPLADLKSPVVGYVYGVRFLEREALDTLVQVGQRFHSAQTNLLIDQQVVLSAPAGVTSPVFDITRLETNRMIEEANILAVRASVPGLLEHGVSIIFAVSAKEALDPIKESARLRVILILALLFLFIIAMLAAWRHGASVIMSEAASDARHRAEKEEALRKFLQHIADRQPTIVAVADGEDILRFSNKELQSLTQVTDEIAGVPVPKLFGEHAQKIQKLIEEARAADFDSDDFPDILLQIQNHYYHFSAVPMEEAEHILLVGSDLTELLSERERREANMAALIDTLTNLIDARDPGSANHSLRVSRLAEALGGELGYDELTQDTLHTAGQLMNLGKILLPRKLLTKDGKLTDEERTLVSDAIAKTSTLLKDVPFDGPVAETIAGIGHENPTRLSQIITICNAFVSMISPRSFRKPLTPHEAIETLRKNNNAETIPLISALAHFIDNRNGLAVMEGEKE